MSASRTRTEAGRNPMRMLERFGRCVEAAVTGGLYDSRMRAADLGRRKTALAGAAIFRAAWKSLHFHAREVIRAVESVARYPGLGRVEALKTYSNLAMNLDGANDVTIVAGLFGRTVVPAYDRSPPVPVRTDWLSIFGWPAPRTGWPLPKRDALTGPREFIPMPTWRLTYPQMIAFALPMVDCVTGPEPFEPFGEIASSWGKGPPPWATADLVRMAKAIGDDRVARFPVACPSCTGEGCEGQGDGYRCGGDGQSEADPGTLKADAVMILADAAEDAGCPVPGLVEHLRADPAAHWRGCWAVDTILGGPS